MSHQISQKFNFFLKYQYIIHFNDAEQIKLCSATKHEATSDLNLFRKYLRYARNQDRNVEFFFIKFYFLFKCL